MRERCKISFDAVLQYCIKSLHIESDASMRCLEGDLEEDIYCTIMYNDETHTFEQVFVYFFFLANSYYLFYWKSSNILIIKCNR